MPDSFFVDWENISFEGKFLQLSLQTDDGIEYCFLFNGRGERKHYDIVARHLEVKEIDYDKDDNEHPMISGDLYKIEGAGRYRYDDRDQYLMLSGSSFYYRHGGIRIDTNVEHVKKIKLVIEEKAGAPLKIIIRKEDQTRTEL